MEYMEDYLTLDIVKNEIEVIERVSGCGARDEADLREAIHEMVRELAKLKGVDISDIDIDDESWADI